MTLASAAFALGVGGKKLRVLATVPDLADIAREIGGERVDVDSICRGTENVHLVRVRPSNLVAASRADVWIQIGLSFEVAFAPGLLQSARNPRIRVGAPGFVNVSEGWAALDVPESVSRRGGDLHPEGNPHMNLDPRAGAHMAERVLAGLVASDPEGEADYRERFVSYSARLAEHAARWEALAEPWAGKRVVVYHQEFDYLCAARGIEVLGTVEPKPGIPPTPNSLAALIAKMKAEGCDALLTAAWSNNRSVEKVASEAGVPVIELPHLVGGLPGVDSWIGLQDELHRRLAEVLSPTEAKR